MTQSIIVIGPQGCGKTLNAPALARAYGLNRWVDADVVRHLPREDCLILAHETPAGARGIPIVPFAEAIKRVAKPHPATPGLVRVSDAQRTADAIRFLESRGFQVEAQQPALLPDLLTLEQVERMTTLKKSSIYKMQKAGQFPASKKVGPRRVVWKRAEVQAWLERVTT